MEYYRSKLINTASEEKCTPTDDDLKISQNISSSNNLFVRIKGLLILGKFLGIIPCEGVFQKDFRRFRFKRWSIGSIIGTCISLALALNAVVSFIRMCRVDKDNAVVFARSGSGVAFYFYGTFAYVYFLRHAKEFTKLFSKWATLPLRISLDDKSLSRDAAIITGVVFSSAVLENLVLQCTQFSVESGAHNSTEATLRAYYQKAYRAWADIVPYHWFWSILAFITNKLALYAWNFVEILIAVLSRALSGKFRLLNEVVELRTSRSLRSIDICSYDEKKTERLIWTYLVRDHSAICILLDRFENFLSPLIFCSYAIDIYYCCLLLLLSLIPAEPGTNKKSPLYTVYAAWSFFHLTIRLYIVSISAANINAHAHYIGRVLRSCPMECYTKEIERIERKLKTNPEIGMTGLGCFTVTKPFILSIIGVVFTFEIVLLQSYPQPNCSV